MRKLYKCFWMLLLAACFGVLGCRKTDRSTVKNISGMVDSTGLCGFLIKIKTSGTTYNAVNLPVLYQSDSVKVVMSYHLLDTRFYCLSGAANGYAQIYIDAIHKE